MNPNELLQKRAALIKQARELHDKATAEKRSMTAEETAGFDKMLADAADCKTQAERLTSLEAEERAIAEVAERRTAANAGEPTPETRGKPAAFDMATELRALNHYMLTGSMPEGYREQRAGTPFTTTAAAGGYMAPTEVAREVITRMQDEVYMLSGSRYFPLSSAKAIDVPKITTEMTAAAWRAETAAATADAATVFGATTLTPKPLSLKGWVSNNLLEASANLAEDAILYEISRNMAEGLETALVVGTGSGQPTGVFNETGALTTREVHGDSDTGFDWNDLVTCLMYIRKVYRRNASWLIHRDFVSRALKLSDGEGRPIYIPSIVTEQPDRLLGFPVWESEFASNTFTADKRIAVFGDFKRGYGVAMTLAMKIVRLLELYAEYDGTGYVAHLYADGNVIDANAFAALHTAV